MTDQNIPSHEQLVKKIQEFLNTQPDNDAVERFYCNQVLPYDKRSITEILSVYNEADDWCECEDRDIYDTEFWDDGEHEHVYKHHYRCGDCGKITQIG